MSLLEVVTSTLIGIGVSLWANYAVLPLFGFKVKLAESFAITLIFTVMLILRSYLVRRLFESCLNRLSRKDRRSPTVCSSEASNLP